MVLRILPLFAVLAACTQIAAPRPIPIAIQPDANGLSIGNLGQRIDFGRSPEGVINALDRERGPHRILSLAGCPAEVIQHLQWGDLALTFTDEQFVGWRQGAQMQGRAC